MIQCDFPHPPLPEGINEMVTEDIYHFHTYLSDITLPSCTQNQKLVTA